MSAEVVTTRSSWGTTVRLYGRRSGSRGFAALAAAEHSSTIVQFNQPACCAVIGRETLIGGEHGTARRAGETVWMGIGSRIAEVTEQARVNWVAEVEDERVPRIERVGKELARGHLVFDVVRAAPALRGQRADDLPVGCRTAIHVHDRQKIVGVLVDVPGPDKEVSAATGFPCPRHRRTAARRQEEQANGVPPQDRAR